MYGGHISVRKALMLSLPFSIFIAATKWRTTGMLPTKWSPASEKWDIPGTGSSTTGRR